MLSYAEIVSHPGNAELQRALELSVLAAMRGESLHVHAEGLRGTGKTTVMRAAAGLLGDIRRVAGCPYNCAPSAPHCPLHRELPATALAALGAEIVPRPFLEVSASAKIGTVVGSIDLGRLTASERAEAALLPGTLARAHRGIVFVDEVNRLADTSPELADALLDLMGTKPGRLQIEEAGLPPVVLRLRVTVWAASNPDEEPGPLADVRRQLADRFDLAVAMRRPVEPTAVVAVLRHADAGSAVGDGGDADGAGPGTEPAGGAIACGGNGVSTDLPDAARAGGVAAATPRAGTSALRAAMQERAGRRPPELDDGLRWVLARLYCDFQLESLRAVQAWQLAGRLQALREGRERVIPADLALVAPSVLRHRLEAEDLARVLEAVEDGRAAATAALAGALPSRPGGPGPAVSATVAAHASEKAAGAPLPPDEAPDRSSCATSERSRPVRASRAPGPAASPQGARAISPPARPPGHARAMAALRALLRLRPAAGAPAMGQLPQRRDRGAPSPSRVRGAQHSSETVSEGRASADALARPSDLPPLTPRRPARFLSDLPPEDIWAPATGRDSA